MFRWFFFFYFLKFFWFLARFCLTFLLLLFYSLELVLGNFFWEEWNSTNKVSTEKIKTKWCLSATIDLQRSTILLVPIENHEKNWIENSLTKTLKNGEQIQRIAIAFCYDLFIWLLIWAFIYIFISLFSYLFIDADLLVFCFFVFEEVNY